MSLGRRSMEEHPDGTTEERESLVILRRKHSTDHPEVTCSNPTGGLARAHDLAHDRTSKVQSVSCDVMSGEPIRMMGYMEKKLKLLGWKRYWFVLDGHLLTYFKSKSDYESLSTFSGSITLGNVSNVRPIQIKNSKGFPMQIVSRNQVYFLRCAEKSVLEEWVLALQETISVPPQISSPIWADPGVQFYRYSFASVSEWSIAESQRDISGSLSNLPKNFYLRQPRGDPLDLNPPLKYKCQSFANLPRESLPESPSTSIRSNQSGMNHRPDPKMRYSASLLQLESSPQATELKRELASKLSIGHVVPSAIRNGSQEGHSLTSQGHPEMRGENSNFPRTSSEPRINQDVLPPAPVTSNREPESWRSNSKMAQPSLSQSTSLASIAEGFEPQLSRRPLTLPIDLDEKKKKKKGIGNLIQKMFKREDSFKRKREEGQMIISGPVDLRAQRMQSERPTHSAQSPLPHSPSTPNFQGQTPGKGSQEMINELKKVQLRRKYSENESPRDSVPEGTNSQLSTSPQSYDQKLAKFNRISSQLNSNVPPSASGSTGVSRSSSCRVKSTQEELIEEPPMLPPKKRTLPRDVVQMSAYDTPKNNSPVHWTHPPELTFVPEVLAERERKVSLRELLTKKNSAPEMSFGGSEEIESPRVLPLEEIQKNDPPPLLPKRPMGNDHPPTLTSTDSDIDNLDILSDYSGDELSLKNNGDEPIYSRVAPDPPEAIYEEIKYAKQEINLTELETVEEFGDEDDELYDEFVTPMTSIADGNMNRRVTNEGCASAQSSGSAPLRFSGMSALQEYLDGELGMMTSDDPATSTSFKLSGNEKGAALNRLGRSLAVEKLGTLLK